MSAYPAPPNPGNEAREAVDILRRLEPALTKLDERLRGIDDEVGEIKPALMKLDERLRNVEGEVRELKGRFTGIEGRLSQLPTTWTIAALVFSIFGFAFLLLRFAAPAAHG